MLVAFVVVVSIIYAIYSFYTWHHSYWKRRGVPGPPPRFFSGHLKELSSIRNPPLFKLHEWTKKYGKVYAIYEGMRKVLVISDIDMINEIFVKRFDCFYERKLYVMAGPQDGERLRVHSFEAKGKRWKRLRVMTNTMFTNNGLKQALPIITDTGDHMLIALREQAAGGKAVDVLKLCQTFTMDIIKRLVCGQPECRWDDTEWIQIVRSIFGFDQDRILFYLAAGMPTFQPFLRKLYYYMMQFENFPYAPMFRNIERAVDDRMREREDMVHRGETPPSVDFIDMLLDARLEADEVDMSDTPGEIGELTIRKTMHREEIIAQCFIFIIGGFESTANQLSTLLYDLSIRPEIVERMREEMDEHCTDEITFDSVNSLQYTDAVLKEAFRMHTLTSFAVSRVCTTKCTVGDIDIEPGTFVQADVYSVHHDKELWGEDADEFRPERFLESSTLKHSLQWMPFGAGPRTCPGRKLTLVEQKVALTNILRNFDVYRGPNTEKSLHMMGSLSLGPDSLTLYFKERTH